MGARRHKETTEKRDFWKKERSAGLGGKAPAVAITCAAFNI
jgi:hypothetical protein